MLQAQNLAIFQILKNFFTVAVTLLDIFSIFSAQSQYVYTKGYRVKCFPPICHLVDSGTLFVWALQPGTVKDKGQSSFLVCCLQLSATQNNGMSNLVNDLVSHGVNELSYT